MPEDIFNSDVEDDQDQVDQDEDEELPAVEQSFTQLTHKTIKRSFINMTSGHASLELAESQQQKNDQIAKRSDLNSNRHNSKMIKEWWWAKSDSIHAPRHRSDTTYHLKKHISGELSIFSF